MRRFLLAFIAVSAAGLAASVAQQALRYEARVERTGFDLGTYAVVNWTDGAVRAHGTGATARAARVRAMGAIPPAVEGIPVNDERRVKDYAGLKRKVRAFIQGARETGAGEEELDGRRVAWVEMEVPLKGVKGLGSIFIEEETGRKPPGADGIENEETGGGEEPAGEKGTLVEQLWSGAYDGALLDARGTGLIPALLPRIVSEEGETVHDIVAADLKAAVKNGVATYVTVEESTGLNPRERLDPLCLLIAPRTAFAARVLLGGVRAEGKLKTNLVVNKETARKMKENHSKELKECRVVIIVDKAVGGIKGSLPFEYARAPR
ncbi:MAG: hypothetical protein AB1742_16335 [bacterium]